MKASTEQLAAMRLVARRLGALSDDAVFVGGITAGLLVTNPGSPTARPTKDVDLILEIASTVEYTTRLRDYLCENGFSEDTRPGAPICRWVVDGVTVDLMPTDSRVLGFSNEWYGHAIRTAKTMALPPDNDGVVSIRVISAPSFLATKFVAWKARGAGDLLHHDIEDIVAIVDGRDELLSEVENEPSPLRRFIADAVAALFASTFEDQIAGHLLPDDASQGRLPQVLTSLRRMERCSRITRPGETVMALSNGDPGATTVPVDGAWTWKVLQIVVAVASKPPVGSSHIAVIARLTSHSKTAGIAGDGRDVLVEDGTGHRFKPLYKLLQLERERRGMPGPYDQILPGEAFETVWVFEVPMNRNALRLLLPFDSRELPFERPA